MRTTRIHRRLFTGVAALAVGLVALTGITDSVPARAEGPPGVMQVRVVPTSASVDTGAPMPFRVEYSCSSLAASCVGATITADAPVGLAPDGQEIPVQPGSGSGLGNAGTTVTASDDAVVFDFGDLPAGSTGELVVTWLVPALSVPGGTQFRQTVRSTSGGATQADVTSDPVTTSAGTTRFNAVIETTTPATSAMVVTGQDTTYRVYGCNDTGEATGGIGFRNLAMTLTLPDGTEFVSASGSGQQSGNTVTWPAAGDALNTSGCAKPGSFETVTVRYPVDTFQPPLGNPPSNNTVTVTLTATATSLTGDALSETARAEHTFHGEWEINDDWEKGIIASLWDGGANSASSKYLTSDDTKTLYGWGAATGWMTTPPGRVIDHNRLGMAGTRTRFPCLVDGEAKAPDSLIRDPYNDFSPQDWEEMPGVWSLEELPEDHCQNPAFALNQIQFGNDDWRYISTISLFTWNGSEANVRTMDVRGMTEKKTVFIYETPGRGLASDAPIAVDEHLPEAPVLPALPEPEPRHPDATAPDGTSPVELPDPGPEGLSGVNTAAGELGSPDALLSFGLDRNEIVTDVRLSMMRYPHAQTSWSHFFGRSTQAFADSGLRTMQGLNSSNTSIYEHSPHETPWPYDMRTDQVGATQNFLDPVPDARVAVTVPEGIQAVSPGQRLTWRTTITNGPGGTRLTPLLSVIIPNGLALDPDSIAWSDLGMVDGVEPTLRTDTVDVDGVERTRLTWSWPDAQVIDSPNREDSPDYPFHESGEVPTVTFETTAVPSVLEGTHDGRASLIAHGMDRLTPVVPPNASLPVDEWDANDNGDTGEYVGEDRVAWTAIAISGAHIAKAVTSAGDDGEWSAAGTVAASWTEDAAFRVRIRTENPNNMRLSDLVAYDVLPRDGDTAISEALQGQARGSAWTPVFAGIEETPDGMEVAYSTAENPCRPELFPGGQPGCTDDWSGTAPAKLSDVTALRLTHAGIYGELDEDAPPLDLIYGMTAPPMTAAMANAATAGDPAVTNVAWRTSRISSAGEVVVLPYAEAPSASVRRDVAVIGGETWLDEDGNGHRDAAEAPVSGLPVALQDASGAAITDAAGDPVRTTSDGSYRLTVPAGSYALAFPTDADGVPLTEQLAPGEPATASVPDQKSGVSAEFSVLRTEARLDQNAGYFLADGGTTTPPTTGPTTEPPVVDPGKQPPTDGGTPPLADTGAGVAPAWPFAGGILLLVGGAIVLARRFRHRAG